MALDEELEMES